VPAAVRKGDNDTGHGCYPPRQNTGSAGNTFINGLLAHRQGDAWPNHACPNTPPHPGTTAAGSPNVMIEGMPAARVGDSIDCGGVCASGSSNVFYN